MPDLRKVAEAASHALRSYQYGNSAEDLAREVADALDEALADTAKPASDMRNEACGDGGLMRNAGERCPACGVKPDAAWKRFGLNLAGAVCGYTLAQITMLLKPPWGLFVLIAVMAGLCVALALWMRREARQMKRMDEELQDLLAQVRRPRPLRGAC